MTKLFPDLLLRSRTFLGSSRRYLLNRLDNPALVLLYHRVTRLEQDPQLLSVSPENFYDQVAFLKSNYTLLEIEEFAGLMAGRKKIPPRAVVISFDDGYADNYSQAIPILEALGGQALFFITTSHIDTPYELWWDELERIFLDRPRLPPVFTVAGDAAGPLQLPAGSIADRRKIYDLLHPLLKYKAPALRDKMIGEFQQWASVTPDGRPTHRLMTTGELAKMNASKAAVIGAHTHNHPALSVLSADEQREEIGLSKNFLQKALEKDTPYFSYPYGGKKDYNSTSVAICREAGFTMTFSNQYGQVRRRTDPFRIPRVLVRDWDRNEFSRQLAKSFRY